MKMVKIIIVSTILLCVGVALISCAEKTEQESENAYEATADDLISPVPAPTPVGAVSESSEAYEYEILDAVRATDLTPLEEVINNPDYFTQNQQGELTLVGFVSNIGSQFFYIQNADGTAELMIDFRGNQAFPQEGDEITVKGELIQNCCDPSLYMLRAMRFELVG